MLTLDEISMITGRRVRPAAAAAEDVAALLARLNRLEEDVAEFVDEEPGSTSPFWRGSTTRRPSSSSCTR